MSNERENECTALALIDKGDVAVRKRQELEEAIEGEIVAEPISLTAILTSIAISAATTGASYLLSRAFAPKPPAIEKGRTTGQLVISSQLGILIPEAYFGAGEDGFGGTWLPTIVISLSPIAKQVNVSRQEVGGGKGGGSQTQEVREILYYFPYLALMYGRGPLRPLKLKANADTIYDLYGQVSTYEGESASSYTEPYEIVAYEAASGGKEVTLQNHASGNGGIVQWNNVQSNGAATRRMIITYRTDNTSPMPIEYTLNGGTPVAVTLPTTNESFMQYSIALSLNDGLNTIKIQNKHTVKNLGIDKIYVFPGHTTAGTSTGVLDPTVTPDVGYDPTEPPDPTSTYLKPFNRFDSVADTDEYNAQTGTLLHGGQFAFYSGNYEQMPDPTMEGAINALHGADSTPAYRGRAIEVDANLFLTRWGNAIPNRTGLFEHDTIRTLEQFCAYMSSRVKIVSGDYDYSEFDEIRPRGRRMLGQRYEPKVPMMEAGTIYNAFFVEEDFKIVGKLHGGASVATLTDEDFGWIEGDELPENLSLIDITEVDPMKQPARVEVKSLDLDRDGDPGLQGYGRHETVGVETETLDLSDWTLIPEESQALAQRVQYQRYVEKPLNFWLSWKFLWLNAGNVITAVLSTGYTYEIQIDKITGGVGQQVCEGHLVDTPVYTQPVSIGSNGFGSPAVPIPASTILALLDIPLRDRDETENLGVGPYGAMTPRTNSGQVWTGGSLYVGKLGWERLADFTLPGSIGVIVSFANLSTNTSDFDRTGEIVFDVYHSDGFTPVLESVSEADVLDNGANLLAINTPDGEILTQFANAEQVSANRWKVTTLLHGRRGTEHLVSSYATGRRVVLLNEAVQFIPFNLSELNVTRDFKAVSFGQSLDDAATVEFAWTGQGKQPRTPDITSPAQRDSMGNLLIEAYGVARVGGGMRGGQGGATHEEELIFKAQILNSGSPILPNGRERVLTFGPGMSQAAALVTHASDVGKFDYIDVNTLSVSGTDLDITARALQEILATGNFVEATLKATGEGVAVLRLVDKSTGLNRYGILVNGGLAAGIYVQIGDGIPTTVGDYTPGDEVRFRITLSGAEARFYQNYAGTGTPPLYVSALAPAFPLIPEAVAASGSSGGGGGTAQVQKMILTTQPYAKTIYAASQQRDDFLIDEADPVPEEIQMDVWQYSPLIGDGIRKRITL